MRLFRGKAEHSPRRIEYGVPRIPERRKIALVATAHYLLRCMHAMLISGKPWHEAA